MRSPFVIIVLLLSSYSSAQIREFVNFSFRGQAFNGLGSTPLLETAGDINGDGHVDLAFSSPVSIQIISGFDGEVLHSIVSPIAGFISPIVGVGDIDLDGHDDFAIAQPIAAAGGAYRGQIVILSGATGNTIRVITGNNQDRIGSKIGNAGDVNGDGFPDLIAGGSGNYGLPNSGFIRVYSGFDGSVIHFQTGFTAQDEFGLVEVGGVGDLDADGNDDFAVSAKTGAGTVYVFSGTNGQLIRTISAGFQTGIFGSSFHRLNDVNSDSVPEILVAAYGRLNIPGSVYVVNGATGIPIHTIQGSSMELLGRSICSLSDLDGDGVADFATSNAPLGGAGIPESIYVYSGATGNLLKTFSSPLSSVNSYGVALCDAENIQGPNSIGLGVLFAQPSSQLFHLDPYCIALQLSATTHAPYRPIFGAVSLGLDWDPAPGTFSAPMTCKHGSPFSVGLLGMSFAQAEIPLPHSFPLLISDAPSHLIGAIPIGFDVTGSFMIPGVTNKSPTLAGLQIFFQAFESSPQLQGSNGLMISIVP